MHPTAAEKSGSCFLPFNIVLKYSSVTACLVMGLLEDRNLVWQRSLRPLDPGVEEGKKKKKPAWNVSSKKISASDVTTREGGSLWTARKM